MRTYEVLYIVKPDLGEDEVEKIAKEIEAIATADGGKTITGEIWGKRKLAFEVDDLTEGDYAVVDFHATPDSIAEIDRVLRITDSVVRFMLVRREDRE